jgi:hypothetical protein
MFPSLALAALVALVPAQPAALNLTNVRNTYGQLGPTRASSKFLPGDVVFLAYDIEGVTVGEDGRVQYSTQLEVFDKDAKSLFKQDPAERLEFIPLGGGRIPAQAFITIGVDQPAGEYTAKVVVTDKVSKQSKTLERKFEVAPGEFGLVGVYASADDRGSNPAPTTGVVGQTIFIFYSAVGFKRDEKKNPNMQFEMTPLDDAGKPTLGKPISHVVTFADEKLPTYPLRFALPLTRPGKFSVRLSCTDKISGKTATMELPVLVIAAEK